MFCISEVFIKTGPILLYNFLVVFRKRSVPVYMKDFVEADLENPAKRHKYWNISQSAISKLRKTNKKFATMICKYKKKINTLNDLLDDLKKKFQISSESSIVLKVFTHEINIIIYAYLCMNIEMI